MREEDVYVIEARPGDCLREGVRSASAWSWGGACARWKQLLGSMTYGHAHRTRCKIEQDSVSLHPSHPTNLKSTDVHASSKRTSLSSSAGPSPRSCKTPEYNPSRLIPSPNQKPQKSAAALLFPSLLDPLRAFRLTMDQRALVPLVRPNRLKRQILLQEDPAPKDAAAVLYPLGRAWEDAAQGSEVSTSGERKEGGRCAYSFSMASRKAVRRAVSE